MADEATKTEKRTGTETLEATWSSSAATESLERQTLRELTPCLVMAELAGISDV